KAHYFQALEKHDSAVVYYHRILDLDKIVLEEAPQHPPSHSNIFKDYINLSQNYLQLQQPENGKNYLEKAKTFIKQDSAYLSGADYLLYQEALVNYFFQTQQFDKAFQEYNL